MAFDVESLVKIGGQNQAQSLFTYNTDDSQVSVLASGYFNGAVGSLREHDYIIVRNGIEDYMLRVSQQTKPITVDYMLLLNQQGNQPGYGVYIGGTTEGSPQVINAGVTAAIINDATIRNDTSASDPNYLPVGETSLYNTTGNLIEPTSLGDLLLIQINFSAASSVVNGVFRIQLDISAAKDQSFLIHGDPIQVQKGAGVFNDYSSHFMGFVGSSFLANGAQWQIESITGNTSIARPVLNICRLIKGTP